MKSSKPRIGSDSPWGVIQSVSRVRPGVVFVSTASHGGYALTDKAAKRVARIARDTYPSHVPATRDWQWLEEDCDWALVWLAWPEVFPAEAKGPALAILTTAWRRVRLSQS